MLGEQWKWPSNCILCDGVVCARGDDVVPTMCFLQVGDGTSGSNALTPVGVVGLDSGVLNVALGGVCLLARRVCWLF